MYTKIRRYTVLRKTKIKFRKYGIELDDSYFKGLSNQEIKECKRVIRNVKRILKEA